jgi:hypothetical protein
VRAACRSDQGARGFYDFGPYHRIRDHQKAAGIVFQDTASVLFGVEGLQVTDAQALPDGTLEVWAVTGDPVKFEEPHLGGLYGGISGIPIPQLGSVCATASRSINHAVNLGRRETATVSRVLGATVGIVRGKQARAGVGRYRQSVRLTSAHTSYSVLGVAGWRWFVRSG